MGLTESVYAVPVTLPVYLRMCSVLMRLQVADLKWNWKSELFFLAPDWPEKTNMQSLATAIGKLQQVGGHSPAWQGALLHCIQTSLFPCVNLSVR